MIADPPVAPVCRSCRRPRDERGRCFHCCDWWCVRCGDSTGSALLSLCMRCGQLGEEPPVPTTVYGKPAVEVEQPGGDVVAYLLRALPEDETTDQEWRAWVVTSPKGDEHRVSESPDGRAHCSCPAWKYNRYEAGRWREINGAKVCKHVAAVLVEVLKITD